MFTFKLKSLVVLFGFLLAIPNISFAYFTTGQTATKINENTLLYTVSYKFNFGKNGGRMPIGAVRGLEFGTSSPYVGYDLLQDSETPVTVEESYSVVLSNAKVVDNEYYVPPGQTASFILVALVHLPPNFVPESTRDYDLSLQVTSLPFTILSEEKEFKNQLNPSELQYYLTPEIDIKVR